MKPLSQVKKFFLFLFFFVNNLFCSSATAAPQSNLEVLAISLSNMLNGYVGQDKLDTTSFNQSFTFAWQSVCDYSTVATGTSSTGLAFVSESVENLAVHMESLNTDLFGAVSLPINPSESNYYAGIVNFDLSNGTNFLNFKLALEQLQAYLVYFILADYGDAKKEAYITSGDMATNRLQMIQQLYNARIFGELSLRLFGKTAGYDGLASGLDSSFADSTKVRGAVLDNVALARSMYFSFRLKFSTVWDQYVGANFYDTTGADKVFTSQSLVSGNVLNVYTLVNNAMFEPNLFSSISTITKTLDVKRLFTLVPLDTLIEQSKGPVDITPEITVNFRKNDTDNGFASLSPAGKVSKFDCFDYFSRGSTFILSYNPSDCLIYLKSSASSVPMFVDLVYQNNTPVDVKLVSTLSKTELNSCLAFLFLKAWGVNISNNDTAPVLKVSVMQKSISQAFAQSTLELKMTALTKSLTDLNAVYSSLPTDPETVISVMEDLVRVGDALKMYITRIDEFSGAKQELDLKVQSLFNLFLSIRTNFNWAWAYSATGLTSANSDRLTEAQNSIKNYFGADPLSSTEGTQNSLDILTGATNSLLSQAATARATLLYSDRVQNLQTRLLNFSSADLTVLPLFLKDLSNITTTTSQNVDGTLDLNNLGMIVQAFPDDISLLNQIVNNLKTKMPAQFKTGLPSASLLDQISDKILASPTVEEFFQALKNFESARPTSFTKSEVAIFVKMLDRVLQMRTMSTDQNAFLADLSQFLNIIVLTQMKDQKDLISQRIQMLGVQTYDEFEKSFEKIQALLINPNNLGIFFQKLNSLVDLKIEASQESVKNLKIYLASNELADKLKLQIDSSGSKKAMLNDVINKLEAPIPYSKRIDNLVFLIENNPASRYPSLKAVTTLEPSSTAGQDTYVTGFLSPFFRKLEWLNIEKNLASADQVKNVVELIRMVSRDVGSVQRTSSALSLNLGTNPLIPDMFNGKTVTDALEYAIANLQSVDVGKTTIQVKTANLITQVDALQPKDTLVAQKIVQSDLPALLNLKVDANSDDIKVVNELLDRVYWNDVINKGTYSVVVDQKSLKSSDIKTIVDTVFRPFWQQDRLEFADVFNSIVNLSRTAPLSPEQKNLMFSRAQSILTYLDQGTDSDLKTLKNVLSTARFNYMRDFDAKLAPVVATIQDALSKRSSTGLDDIFDFASKFAAIKALITGLTETGLSAAFDKLSKALTELAQNKQFAQRADLQSAVAYFSTDNTYTTNQYILYRGGAAILQPQITLLQGELTILQHYDAMQKIIRNLAQKKFTATPVSPATTATTADKDAMNSVITKNANLLKEKMGIILAGAWDLFASSTTAKDQVTKDVVTYVNSLETLNGVYNDPAQKQDLTVDPYDIIKAGEGYASIADFKNKFNVASRDYELLMLPFSQKIAKLTDLLKKVNNNDAAVSFADYVGAVINKRLEAVGNDLDDLQTLIEASFVSDWPKFYSAAKGMTDADVTNVYKSWLLDVQKPVTNDLKVSWLIDIMGSAKLATHHPDLILSVFADLDASIKSDPVSNSKIQQLLIKARSASRSTMKAKANDLNFYIDKFTTFINSQSSVVVNPDVLKLTQDVENISSTASVNSFVIRVETILTKQRADLTPNEIDSIKNVLTVVQFKKGFSTAEDTVKSRVTALLNSLAIPLTFKELQQDLKKFVATQDNVAQVTIENLDKFMNKVQKLVSLKDPSFVQYEDNVDIDPIFDFIATLKNAAYNKFSSKRSDLDPIIKNMEAFRQQARAKLTPLFSTQLNSVLTDITNVKTLDDAKNLLIKASDLVKNKISGTDKQLEKLSGKLQTLADASSSAVFRAGLSASYKDLASQVSATGRDFSVEDLVVEVQKIIEQYPVFSDSLKIEFFEKIQRVVNTFKAKGPSLSAGLVNDLKNKILNQIRYAISNVFQDGDVYTTDSVGVAAPAIILNSTSSGASTNKYLTILDDLIATVNSIVPSIVGYISFKFRLQTLLTSNSITKETASNSYNTTSFNNITKDNVERFVKDLAQLIDEIVDATNADILDLKTLIKNQAFSTNLVLISQFKNDVDFASKFLQDIDRPISFTDRVSNFTNYITLVKDTAIDKDLFMDKLSIIYAERWRAKGENLDLKTLKNLINVMQLKFFSGSAIDTVRAQNNKIISMLNDFLNPVAPSSQTPKEKYDFSIKVTAVQQALQALTKPKFDDFIKLIEDAASARINAIYLLDADSKDQARTLYDQLQSNDTMTREVIYGSNQAKVKASAEKLIQAYSYKDLHKNLDSFALDYLTFDDDLTRLFLRKVHKMVKLKKQGDAEAFDFNLLTETLSFVEKNRISGDDNSKVKLQTYRDQLASADATISVTEFKDLLDVWRNNYFGGKKKGETSFAFSLTAATGAEAFLTELDKMLVVKADSLPEELTEVNDNLSLTEVVNHKDLFTNQDRKNRLNNLKQQFATPVKFDQYADNIVNLLNNPTFDATAQARFLKKMDNLVSKRSQGYTSGFDMPGLLEWIDYALANQMVGNDQLKTFRRTLAVEPTASEDFVSYQQKLDAKKAQLKQIMQKGANSKPEFDAWLKTLQELVDLRVDGLVFNNNNNSDDNSLINGFINFLKNDVLNNRWVSMVLGKAENQANNSLVLSYISFLEAPVTFAELIANFRYFIQAQDIFVGKRKIDAFKEKVDRMVFKKDSATDGDRAVLVQLLSFAKVNSFKNQDDSVFIDNYITQINNITVEVRSSDAAYTATLSLQIEGILGQISSLTDSATFDNLSSIVSLVQTLVDRADSLRAQFLSNSSFISDVAKIKIVITALLEKMSKNTKFSDDQKSQVTAKLLIMNNKIMVMIPTPTS